MRAMGLALIAVCCVLGQTHAKKLSDSAIKRLVKLLEHRRANVRVQAAEKLSTLDHVPELLEKAALSDNPMLAESASKIIDKINTSIQEKALQGIMADIKDVKALSLIKQMTADPAPNDIQAKWKIIGSLSKAIAKQSKVLHGDEVRVFQLKFPQLKQNAAANGVYSHGKYVIRGVSPQRISNIDKAVVLSNIALPRCSMLVDSVVFINGDFEGTSQIRKSILFVNGDIKRLNMVDDSIVLCTGSINRITKATNSLLHTLGTIERVSSLKDTTVMCESGDLQATSLESSTIYAHNNSTKAGSRHSQSSRFFQLNKQKTAMSPMKLLNLADKKTSGNAR